MPGRLPSWAGVGALASVVLLLIVPAGGSARIVVAPFTGKVSYTNQTVNSSCAAAAVHGGASFNLTTGATHPWTTTSAHSCWGRTVDRIGSSYLVPNVQIPIHPAVGGHRIVVNFTANWTVWANITPGQCRNGTLARTGAYNCEVGAYGWLVVYVWLIDTTSKAVWLFQSSDATTNGVASTSTFGWNFGGFASDLCNRTTIPCPNATYANASSSQTTVVGTLSDSNAFTIRANNSYVIQFDVALYTESFAESSHAQLVGAKVSTAFDAYHGTGGIALRSITIH